MAWRLVGFKPLSEPPPKWLIRTSGTNISEFVSEIHAFSFKKMHTTMSSAKCRSFCPGLNELNVLSNISCYFDISWPFCIRQKSDIYGMLCMSLSDQIKLIHSGRMTNICVNKVTIIGSDNGLPPDQRQAIIWTDAGILLIWPLGTNFSEILTGIPTFSFTKMHLKMSSGKCQPYFFSASMC